jgi:hypothetical protein
MNPLVGDRQAPLLEPRIQMIPGRELPPGQGIGLPYFTPLSTFPLVRARYGWQARGVKP